MVWGSFGGPAGGWLPGHGVGPSDDAGAGAFPAIGDREQNLVLKGIGFDVEPGSFVVITGPSGCGKSTMLNIIAGLDEDYEGSINFGVDGDPRIAYVFQTPRLLPWRTVYENIALALPGGDPRIANIPELLQRVGLSSAAAAYPEMISLGMQRRVALARDRMKEAIDHFEPVWSAGGTDAAHAHADAGLAVGRQ